MTAAVLTHGGMTSGLAAVAAAVDGYLAGLPAAVGAAVEADLLAEIRGLELASRRLASAWNVLLPEVERRGLPGSLSAPSLAALLQAMLVVSPQAATRRVAAARDLGPRVTVPGETLPPILPAVAEAVTAGALSGEQARQIAKVLEQLPASVPVQQIGEAERRLVQAGAQLPPRQLGQVGQRILAHLDPDGVLASDAEQQRRRSFTLTPTADGSYHARGILTPTCGALLQAWLSPHAAPLPATDGGSLPDPRSYGQRMHDALHDLAGLAVRRDELTRSGAPAQVIITIPAEQLTDRTGLVATSFGQLLTVDAALRLADEASLTFLLQDAQGAILAEGRSRRIASRAQTLALIARDRGCSFPDCDKPPEWTQRHHIRAWADGGPTNLDNLTLLCGQHHRRFHTDGWRCTMRDQLPYWIPPPWIDPDQKPRLNQRIQRE